MKTERITLTATPREGTHDIKTDSDDLIYLIPRKMDDGRLLVSTQPSNKVRGKFEPITFEISPEREVRQIAEYIDTTAEAKAERIYEEDAARIEVIRDAITADKIRQSEIVTMSVVA